MRSTHVIHPRIIHFIFSELQMLLRLNAKPQKSVSPAHLSPRILCKSLLLAVQWKSGRASTQAVRAFLLLHSPLSNGSSHKPSHLLQASIHNVCKTSLHAGTCKSCATRGAEDGRNSSHFVIKVNSEKPPFKPFQYMPSMRGSLFIEVYIKTIGYGQRRSKKM